MAAAVGSAEPIEAGKETSVLGGLTLRVVEGCGDSDDCVVDCATKIGLGSLSHLGQDHG